MTGTKWAPSEIENALYDIMEAYEIGFNLYEKGAVSAISDYLSDCAQWQLDCTEWPDMTGGVCYVSFIDNGTLHMINFDYENLL